jgi:hypothetical protein
MSSHISDDALRELVREAIARRAGNTGRAPEPNAASFRLHASHGLLPLARGGDGDGACLIEPTVRCNHCGYCQSYGH